MTRDNPVRYVELHCHTNFSMLDGASTPEAMLERAKAIGMESLAITDHNGLYGIVKFWRASLDFGIKPIFGAEMDTDEGFHIVLLAKNMAGYSNLCRLISRSHLKNEKGHPSLSFDTLKECSSDLFCLSACRKGEVATRLLAGDMKSARAVVGKYQQVFGEDFWIELEHHQLPDDTWLIDEMVYLGRVTGTGCVAANNVHYTIPEGRALQDVLTCIKHQVRLDEATGIRYPNSEYYLKPAEEMSKLFARFPEALDNTVRIAESCTVNLDLTRFSLPSFEVPKGFTAPTYMANLCWDGARRKYKVLTPQVKKQLNHELGVISRAGLAEYFLIVWDIIRFARERRIPAQGRGSAANSIAAYVLDITKVDPIRHNLLFERFLNEERIGMPDIDVDFSTAHREEVIQYVYEKYGQEYTAMVCTVITFRARSAVRDVGKALGFSLDLLDKVAKALFSRSATKIEAEISQVEDYVFANKDVLGLDDGQAQNLPWRQLFDLCGQINGFPRHLGIHVGGMIITATPLIDIVPIENATAPGRVVTQFDKDDVEDIGLIKIDLLGLRTLSVIYDAEEMIRKNRGIDLDLENISLDDPAVFKILSEADTIGVFQVESRAQGQTLPKMQPRCFEDIVVEIAIIRPGPLQGNMVHPFLRRRRGLERVQYLHPKLEPVLAETMGVILFQEQVIRIAMVIAGFTPGEADMFRRAMGRHRSTAEMLKIESLFLFKAEENGVGPDIAKQIFDQLKAFASFGFCKSHSAAFAKTAYDTAYLKVYYAPEFYAGILNNEPMGFYPVEVVVNDAKRHGVGMLPADINLSDTKCTVENGKIRLGLWYVDGLGDATLLAIEEEKGKRAFSSFDDFYRRVDIGRDALENLIMIGAFDSLHHSRRGLIWRLGELESLGSRSGLALTFSDSGVSLPELSMKDIITSDYSILGFSTGHQLLEIYDDLPDTVDTIYSVDLQRLPDGADVKVMGFVVCRQAPPTAKGHVFLTLEDKYGLINLIIRPDAYAQYRFIIRREPVLLVQGRLQRDGKVMSILANRFKAVKPSGPAISEDKALNISRPNYR